MLCNLLGLILNLKALLFLQKLHDFVLLGLHVRPPGSRSRSNTQNHAGKVHRLGQSRDDRGLSPQKGETQQR